MLHRTFSHLYNPIGRLYSLHRGNLSDYAYFYGLYRDCLDTLDGYDVIKHFTRESGMNHVISLSDDWIYLSCDYYVYSPYGNISPTHSSVDMHMYDIIFDPYFREKFCIVRMDEFYRDLLFHIPEYYLGSRYRLECMVRVLCDEMGRVFLAHVMDVSPWRRYDVLMRHWR